MGGRTKDRGAPNELGGDLLCFAVGNDKACGPALRIAEHLLKEVR